MATRGFAAADADGAVIHESFLRYRRFRWLKIAAAAAILSILVYLLVDVQPRHNGGSWLGYTLGTIGFGLILWLGMLGIRKRAITPGRWSLKAWTSAHVYLGLALIVVATLHTGFQFGWNVHTLAYALMMLVIVSGIYGAAAYLLLPQGLSDARAEMTGPQMVEAVTGLDKQVQIAAQPLSDADSAVVGMALDADPFAGGVWQRLSGRYPRCGNRRAVAILRARAGETTDAENDAIEAVVALLERRGAAMDRIRRYAGRRAWLEIWLFFHVPLTIVLIAALVAHVVSIFFYW